MRPGTRKPRRLKVRCYTDHLIDLNEYLDMFPGPNMTDKIGLTEINDLKKIEFPIFGASKSMCRYLTASILLLKMMLICLNSWTLWSIVEHSYKKLLGQMPNVLITSC